MALIGSLTSGVSALRTFGKSIETIGDNIANASTTAFKGSRTRNEDAFAQTLKSATDFNSTLQIGSGVNVASNRQNFNQGSLGSTGVATDIGIAGNGFFLVKPTSGAQFYTRDGNFHLDDGFNLVNAQGNVLQGGTGALTPTTSIPITLLGTKGGVVGASPLASFSIAEDGTITQYYEDGSSAALAAAKITLYTFSDPTSLSRASGNLFTSTPSAGISATEALAGIGAGTLKQGTLEQSNVDLAQEFSELITAQRSFQAGSRIISVSDSVLEEIVNLKR
ncbi:MAG: flagellar hook basal-body protein [Verrucomicrobiae bacterium]